MVKLKEEGILDLAAFALLDESTEGIRSVLTHAANAHQGVRGGTARFLAAAAAGASGFRSFGNAGCFPGDSEDTRRRPLPQSGAHGDSACDAHRR